MVRGKIAFLSLLLFQYTLTAQVDSFAGLPMYQELIAHQVVLAKRLTTITKLFDFQHAPITQTTIVSGVSYNTPSTSADATPITVVQLPAPVPKVYGQDQNLTLSQVFAQMSGLLGTAASNDMTTYLGLLNQGWSFYEQSVSPVNTSLPFENGSVTLSIYTALTGAAITYLSKRITTITQTSYGTTNASTLFQQELSALDQAIESAAATFKKHLTKNDASLVTTYQTIQQHYYQRKAQLLLQLVDPLISALVSCHTMGTGQTTQYTTNLNVQAINGLVQQLFSSLSAFSQTQTTTLLGKYGLPSEVITAISQKLGALYLYQAQVYQNAIEHNMQIWGQPGATLTTFQRSTIMSQVQTCQALFTSAAQYYAAAQQTTAAQGYAQIAGCLQNGLQYWQSALTTLQQGYAGQAAQAFDQASTQFNNAQAKLLGFYVYQQFQQALFTYDQSIISTYENYYQTTVGQYVQQAQKAPTNQSPASLNTTHQTFQSLFYPLTAQAAQNATYKGMAWLAQSALPSFKEILSTLQTLSANAQEEQKQFLQQGIALLQNLTQGAQYLFYSSPQGLSTSTLSADENSSSYSVEGLIVALEQYNVIADLFGKADAVIQSSKDGQYLPFASLFPQGTITSWKQFIMLHQAYWLLVNAQQAQAYVISCSSAVKSNVNQLMSFAVLGLVHAQGLYRSLGIQPMVSYIQTQLDTLKSTSSTYSSKTIDQILQQQAATFTAPGKASPTVQKLSYAVSVYQAGGILGFSALRQQFFDTLHQLKQQAGQNTQDPFQGFTLAAIAVQGLYAQQAGWQTMYDYDADFATALALFAKNITTLSTNATQLLKNGEYQQVITQQQQFVDFYQTFQAFALQQERLAVLYGLTIAPYITVEQIGTLKITFKASTLKNPLLQNPVQEPAYGLASLIAAYAQSQFIALEKSLRNNTFTGVLTDQINSIESQYNQAISYYSSAGLQQQVHDVEKLKSQAIAALYFGLVIPSQQTLSLPMEVIGTQLASQTVTASSGTFSGGISFQAPIAEPTSTPPAQESQSATFGGIAIGQSTEQVKKTNNQAKTIMQTQAINMQKESALTKAVLPLYLLRTFTIDLTALIQTFIRNNAMAQAVTQSSSLRVKNTPVTDTTTALSMAEQLLSDATTYVGKTVASADIQTFIDAILGPLYKIQLQQEGYTGFLTLDQMVTKYKNQLQLLMTQGMTVNKTTYKTQYTIVQQKQSDGTPHIILQGSNVPIDPLAQYQNQTQSALLYYTLCSKFYNTQQATTNVNNVVYMTVSDSQIEQQVNESVQRAYLAGMTLYIDTITDYLATLQTADGTPLSKATFAQKSTLNFSDYQDAYTAIGDMFVWVLALLDSMQQAQQNAGVSYLDVNQKKYDIYVQYAQLCGYFLMGDPTTSTFQSVLKDAANNYYMAAQSDNANILVAYTSLAKLYEAAGDYACTIKKTLPQIDGYPQAGQTGDPGQQGLELGQNLFNNLKQAKVACVAPIRQELYPSNQDLVWYEYQQAAAYYQQAYTMYQKGQAFASSNLLYQPNIARTYGKFFYYDLFSALQQLSLFARNAYEVGFSSQANAIIGTFSPAFQKIIKEGGSAGATQAIQGFNQFTTGSSTSIAADVGQHYTIMRSLLLNGLIYMSGLQGALSQLIKTLGVANAYNPSKSSQSSNSLNNPLSSGYGTLIQCGFTYYIPELQTLIGGSNIHIGFGSKATGSVDTLKPIMDVPSYLLDLQNSFRSIFQARIFHADTFLTAMQYIVENSIGSPATSFTGLANSQGQYLNLLIFNSLVAELWSIMRDVYGQAFLPSLYASKNITAYENAIDSAIQGQEQELLINPASYIG